MSRWSRPAGILVCVFSSAATMGLPAAQRFQRGNSNADQAFNISDPVATLGFLFLGSPAALHCMDAADSDDDGIVNISDAVHSLGFLFLGTPAPPEPFGECGEDPTADALGCEEFAPCPAPPCPPAPPVLQAPIGCVPLVLPRQIGS